MLWLGEALRGSDFVPCRQSCVHSLQGSSLHGEISLGVKLVPAGEAGMSSGRNTGIAALSRLS